MELTGLVHNAHALAAVPSVSSRSLSPLWGIIVVVPDMKNWSGAKITPRKFRRPARSRMILSGHDSVKIFTAPAGSVRNTKEEVTAIFAATGCRVLNLSLSNLKCSEFLPYFQK